MLLIEILRLRGRCEVGHKEADNLWHGHNDAFRQVATTRQKEIAFLAAKMHKRHKRLDGSRPYPSPYRVDQLAISLCFLCLFVALIAVASAGGELACVFFPAAGGWVGGAAARCGIWTTSLVSHLCG